MATIMPGPFMVEANAGNCGLLACTKKSWANKVRETANGIAKCARNSFAIPLPTGRFMHDVGTVGGGQHVTFTRARVIGSGPSAADSAKPTAVRVTGFPRIAPSTVDRLTSATIGFDFSNGVTGAVPRRPAFGTNRPPLRSAMAPAASLTAPTQLACP